MPALEGLSYPDRLAMLTLYSLELKRLTNLIFCYRIFNNLVAIAPAATFQCHHTTSLDIYDDLLRQPFVARLPLSNTSILQLSTSVILFHPMYQTLPY